MTAIVSRTVQDGEPPMIEIKETDDEVTIRLYNKPGPQGGRGSFIGGLTFSKKETFLDMIVALWPDNVAYQFKDNTE